MMLAVMYDLTQVCKLICVEMAVYVICIKQARNGYSL